MFMPKDNSLPHVPHPSIASAIPVNICGAVPASALHQPPKRDCQAYLSRIQSMVMNELRELTMMRIHTPQTEISDGNSNKTEKRAEKAKGNSHGCICGYCNF